MKKLDHFIGEAFDQAEIAGPGEISAFEGLIIANFKIAAADLSSIGIGVPDSEFFDAEKGAVGFVKPDKGSVIMGKDRSGFLCAYTERIKLVVVMGKDRQAGDREGLSHNRLAKGGRLFRDEGNGILQAGFVRDGAKTVKFEGGDGHNVFLSRSRENVKKDQRKRRGNAQNPVFFQRCKPNGIPGLHAARWARPSLGMTMVFVVLSDLAFVVGGRGLAERKKVGYFLPARLRSLSYSIRLLIFGVRPDEGFFLACFSSAGLTCR